MIPPIILVIYEYLLQTVVHWLQMNTGSHRLEEARKSILKNWLSMTDAELAAALGLNIVSIRRLRYRLGLIRHNKLK